MTQTATSKQTQPAQRELTILKRYTFKKDCTVLAVRVGDIGLIVRNDQGATYSVILRRNKAHSCTCTGHAQYHKTCYHIKQCKAMENARAAREKAARQMDELIAQLEADFQLSAPCVASVVSSSPVTTQQQTVVPVVVPQTTLARGMSSIESSIVARDAAILNASLNGNYGFCILKR